MKERTKGFLSGVLTTALLLGCTGTAFAAYQKQATLDYTGIKITLDGSVVTPTDASGNTVEPFAIDGNTYLPVRGIANLVGLGVEWDGATQTVKLTTKAANRPANKPASGETIGQKNALKTANDYLRLMAFSYDGLVQQLEYEKYSHEDAVYAADNCGADWNAQAAKSAKAYLEMTSFSREGLIGQLEFEGFTNAQAVYGVEANGY